MKVPRVDASVLQSHTPEHELESRKRKRFHTAVQPVQPPSCPGASAEAVWLPCWAHQLKIWLQVLVNLHVKCALIPYEAVVSLALAILQNHIQTMIGAGSVSFHPYTFDTMAAAALWVAIKFATPRGAVPGTSFMAFATDVTKDDLRAVELLLLEGVDWDIYAIAKKAGVVNTAPCDP